jgi:hypothetical protein
MKGRCNLKKYVFTPEGMNFQPGNDSPMPDFIDLEAFVLERASSMQDALNDLIELQIHPEAEGLELTLPLDLRNDSRRLFSLREYKEKIPTAS